MIKDFVNLKVTAIDYDPFQNLEIDKIAPSTESQREIWASCVIGGDDANRGYNESISIIFKGTLNVSALNEAFNLLICRNESLRSVFSANGKQICILKEREINIDLQDLSELSLQDQQNFLESFLLTHSQYIFSLADGPLIKAGLLKLNDNHFQLVLTTHHIICDGWSIGVLLNKLGNLYSDHTKEVNTPPLTGPLFSNYAFEQQLFAKSADYELIEKFWLDKFKGQIPELKLPTDFQRPTVRTYKSNRLDFAIDQNRVIDLKKVGFKNGCSHVITLMAAFEVFIHRLTGQSDMVIGLPAADQPITGNYDLIGHCVNLLPIRSRPSPELSFADYLKERKNQILDAYEHQQITFGTLLKKLRLLRNAATVPLIPVVFNVDIGLTDGVNFSGLEFEFISNPREYENFDIFLNITGTNNSYVLEWSYNTHLFKPETIKRMMAGFERVIESVIVDPDIKLKDISLINNKELTESIRAENERGVKHQDAKLLKQLLSEAADKFADRAALIYGEKNISFEAVNEGSNQLARYLIKKGIKVGDVVGLMLDRSPEVFYSILAIMKTGATFLPIDPELPQERVLFILEDSSAEMLITSRKYQHIRAGSVNKLLVENVLSESREQLKTDPDVFVSGNDIAYIIYTSGSTGKPKGVLISQYAILNYIQSSVSAYSTKIAENSGTFFHISLSFDAVFTALFVPLLTGKITVISTEPSLEVFNDKNFVKYAPYDFIKLTPSQLYLLSAANDDQAKYATKRFVLGGEALQKWHLAFLKNNRIDAEIINEYGPTEATVGCISYKFSSLDNFPDDEFGIPIGKPMPNVDVYIINDALQPVPDGIEGEIAIGSIQVGNGYLNRPELTAEKFINNTFDITKGRTIYRTGDLGKITSNGNIVYFGRNDQQIKIRGYRIEPGEIEHLLIKQSNIKQAHVGAREDRIGDQRLIAYVVPDKNYTDQEFTEEVKRWKLAVKDNLPAYMLPSEFVCLKEIPLTVNGKIDIKQLPKTTDQINKTNKAETPMEKLIFSIWEKILEVKNFDIHDDFFELGGHSLIAIEMMTLLSKELNKKFPISFLLEYPTVYRLASVLDEGNNLCKWKALVPIKPKGHKLPLYIVHGAGLGVLVFNNLALALDAEQPLYALQGLGINLGDEPLTTLEDTAALYVSEILQQNPDGPYIIAGFSDGGIIAFEMAGQLERQGKKVKMLAILDTYVDTSLQSASALRFNFINKLKIKSKRFIPAVYHVLRCFAKHPKKAFLHQKHCLKLRIITTAKRLGIDLLPKTANEFIHIKAAMTKYIYLLQKYALKKYNGRIDLFRCNVRINYVDDFKYLGWKPYTDQEIKIHDIPGDHDDMFMAANVNGFAQILQKAINNS